MSERRGSRSDAHVAGRYEIRVNGHLDARWAAWFDGMGLRHEASGQTVIHGLIADQAALHGLLQQVRDLGVSLVSVSRLDDEPDPASAGLPPGPVNRHTERKDET